MEGKKREKQTLNFSRKADEKDFLSLCAVAAVKL